MPRTPPRLPRSTPPRHDTSKPQPPARQVDAELAYQRAHVVVERAREAPDAPHTRARGPALCDVRLDPRLQLVVELAAVGAEELDAVVLPRVVRRRHHG